MSKIVLYGTQISSPCRSVLLLAKALGLDLELKEVNLFAGEHMTPDFLKMNPQHSIPTLDDNGDYLWESHAILPYLVEKYGKNDDLYPKDDVYKRAQINQRLHFDNGSLYGRILDAVVPIYLKGATSIPQETIDAVNKSYEFLETFLQNDSFLVGNTMTIADLSCVASISSLVEIIPADPEKYPKMLAWLKRLESLPYYDEANGIGNKKYIKFIRDFISKNKNNSGK